MPDKKPSERFSRTPAAGTVPHGDPGKELQRPSTGPGERARQPIPPSTTGNAALDTDKEHLKREHEDLYPHKRTDQQTK